jgi:hypothetical protein
MRALAAFKGAERFALLTTQPNRPRRLAVRAAKFAPKPTPPWCREKEHNHGISAPRKMRGHRGANKDSFAFLIVSFSCLSVPQHSF